MIPCKIVLTFSAKARFVLSFTPRSKRSVAENSSASNTVAEGEWMSVCSKHWKG